jgi:hypothetical protein
MQHSVPSVPGRQFERRPVRANAFAHSRGRFQRAKILDYSAGGLHLEGMFGLIKKDPIEVELMSGTRLLGHVAWFLGTRTGIAFSQPLATADPAMLELSRRTGMNSVSGRISATAVA